jgi:glucose-1-phosphate thymidylyltransferase
MAELKAVVLCAGEGTRLRPLTFSRPKHLLPVAGKSLLGRALDTIAEAGVVEVALIVGHQAESVERHIGAGAAWGVHTTYIRQDKPLGLANAVECAREFVGDSPFIVFLGDNLLERGITQFVDDFRVSGPDAALMLREVEDPERYGVAELDEGGRVLRVVEKPAEPRTNLAIVGVYAFTNSIFEAISQIQPSARGEYEITDAIQWLIDRDRRVSSSILEGFWEDAGEPQALLYANRIYLERMEPDVRAEANAGSELTGTLQVGEGTRIVRTRVVGPCFIGANCVLEDSVVGPYVSIGDGCQVRNSVIEDAIIQSASRIINLRAGLKSSVLGEEVVVSGHGHTRMAPPMHMLLGDMTQIRVI